jgi:hypothetical protein
VEHLEHMMGGDDSHLSGILEELNMVDLSMRVPRGIGMNLEVKEFKAHHLQKASSHLVG